MLDKLQTIEREAVEVLRAVAVELRDKLRAKGLPKASVEIIVSDDRVRVDLKTGGPDVLRSRLDFIKTLDDYEWFPGATIEEALRGAEACIAGVETQYDGENCRAWFEERAA